MATTGKINGTKLLVYVGSTAITHATKHTLELNMDTRDATTKDSAGWTETLEGKRNWTISGEAMFAFDATYGHDELTALIINRTSVTLKFSTEVSGDTYFTGTGWLKSCSADASNEETTTYSFSFEGTGALTKSTV